MPLKFPWLNLDKKRFTRIVLYIYEENANIQLAERHCQFCNEVLEKRMRRDPILSYITEPNTIPSGAIACTRT